MKLVAIAALSLAPIMNAADDVVSAVHGTIEQVTAASGTVAVKTADGTKYVLTNAKDAAIHGSVTTANGAEASWAGLKKGTEVVAHYTESGAENVAVEIDYVGKGGLAVTKGTIRDIDRGGKIVVIKTADGSELTFHLTEHATKTADKGIEKGISVAVYSTEESGRKIAHFFEQR